MEEENTTVIRSKGPQTFYYSILIRYQFTNFMYIYIYMYICMCVCAGKQCNTCTHLWKQGQSQMSFLRTHLPCFLKQDLLLGTGACYQACYSDKAGLSVRYRDSYLFLSTPKAGITSTCHQTQVLYGQRCNLGPSSCLLDKHFTY